MSEEARCFALPETEVIYAGDNCLASGLRTQLRSSGVGVNVLSS